MDVLQILGDVVGVLALIGEDCRVSETRSGSVFATLSVNLSFFSVFTLICPACDFLQVDTTSCLTINKGVISPESFEMRSVLDLVISATGFLGIFSDSDASEFSSTSFRLELLVVLLGKSLTSLLDDERIDFSSVTLVNSKFVFLGFLVVRLGCSSMKDEPGVCSFDAFPISGRFFFPDPLFGCCRAARELALVALVVRFVSL